MTRSARPRSRRIAAAALVSAAAMLLGACGLGDASIRRLSVTAATTTMATTSTTAAAPAQIPRRAGTTPPAGVPAAVSTVGSILPSKVNGYRWAPVPTPPTTMPTESGIESVEVHMLVPDASVGASSTTTSTLPPTTTGSRTTQPFRQPGTLVAVFRLAPTVGNSQVVQQFLSGTQGSTVTIAGAAVTETRLRQGVPDCTMIWSHDIRTVVVASGGSCDSLRPVMAAIIVTG